MSNFSSFEEKIQFCNQKATNMHTLVDENKELIIKKITVGDVPNNCWAFRVKFPEGYPFSSVSCSCPPDADGRYETALVDVNDDLIYIDELEYEDVKQFETVDELVQELKNLYDTASNPK